MSDNRDKTPAPDRAPAVESGGEEGFLSRWSRRKTLSRDGVELHEPADDDDLTAVDSEATAQSALPDEAAPADEPPELPPIETLDENSDYSVFMRAEVSPDLRRQALRKFFQSPKFNVSDGLNDYDLDYSKPEPLGDIVTAEMRRRLRHELEKLARLDAEDDNPEEVAAVAAHDDGQHDADVGAEPGPDDEHIESS